MPSLMRCRNKSLKKRMRLVRFAVKFGMELAADKKRMFGQFDDFHQLAIGSKTAEDKTRFLELFTIRIIEFVAVAMALVYYEGAVEPLGPGSHDQLARLPAEPHRAAF